MQVGGEEREVDDQEAHAPATASHVGLFHSTWTTTKKRSVSIASVPVTAMPYAEARCCGGAEADHERHDRGEDRPVDGRHVDLALLARGVQDVQAREEAELDRLARAIR